MKTDFPDSIHYSREKSPGWKISDWDTANKLLSYLSTDGKSFACFEKPDGSYVQCAGCKRRLTVEARIYETSEQYRHYVFGRGIYANSEEKIPTTDFEITVDSSQVLQMRDARSILRSWLEGGKFPEAYVMTDVTATFTE